MAWLEKGVGGHGCLDISCGVLFSTPHARLVTNYQLPNGPERALASVGPSGAILLLHFMICHSNKCHMCTYGTYGAYIGPAPQAVTKNSEVEQNTGKLRHV